MLSHHLYILHLKYNEILFTAFVYHAGRWFGFISCRSPLMYPDTNSMKAENAKAKLLIMAYLLANIKSYNF